MENIFREFHMETKQNRKRSMLKMHQIIITTMIESYKAFGDTKEYGNNNNIQSQQHRKQIYHLLILQTN